MRQMSLFFICHVEYRFKPLLSIDVHDALANEEMRKRVFFAFPQHIHFLPAMDVTSGCGLRQKLQIKMPSIRLRSQTSFILRAGSSQETTTTPFAGVAIGFGVPQ
jgi:protein-arginine kinase